MCALESCPDGAFVSSTVAIPGLNALGCRIRRFGLKGGFVADAPLGTNTSADILASRPRRSHVFCRAQPQSASLDGAATWQFAATSSICIAALQGQASWQLAATAYLAVTVALR
jgi:hypothetical protein